MRFQVRHYQPQQQAVAEETLDATSREELEARLSAGGSVVLAIRQVRDVPARVRRGAGIDVAWWCRELKTLLQAGMTVVEAIETLNAQTSDAARSEVHAGLVASLHQGQPLSQAMVATGAFPGILVAGVRASERTSTLVEALDDYLRFHGMLDEMRKKVVSAAIYPAVVVGLGFLICVFLLTFVIPRFSRMYTGLRGAVSPATEVLIGLSTVMRDHGQWVAFAVLVLIVAVVATWRAGLVHRGASALAARIGPLQSRLDDFRLAKLYQSLALLFRGGYALDEALRQCAELGLGARLTGAVATCRSTLERGERVSAAFTHAGLTDVVSQRLMAVGERSGDFDRVLSTIAERHSERFANFIDRATRVVEPLLLLTVALVVGGIVVMMYMPIFDLASSLH
ncbi:type II secretion system F family protein [Roseateles sp. LYH14W]|uniref:Type II secretion system F family protein n=1 Tax=Pelomonas parva TaxID=3299032 RepID=A0ABW7FA08_9BURK